MSEEELHKIVGEYRSWKQENCPDPKPPRKIPLSIKRDLRRCLQSYTSSRLHELTGLSDPVLRSWKDSKTSKKVSLEKTNNSKKIGFLEISPGKITPPPSPPLKQTAAAKDIIFCFSSRVPPAFISEIAKSVF